jgi:hypothetical protein
VMTSIRRNGSSELLDIVVLIGACLCLISYADCPVEIGCAPMIDTIANIAGLSVKLPFVSSV